MKSAELWTHIHAERTALVEQWSTYRDDQWATASWCGGWTVQQTAGHLVGAAEQTPLKFYKDLIAAGFRFDTFTARTVASIGARPPAELISRMQARLTTTNHPPAPVVAMLGEVVVHGEDIRGALGTEHQIAEPALVAVAENYRTTNLLIGSKRRIDGLRLTATDASWSTGDGPEVAGPLVSLVVAMGGRPQALPALAGEGVSTLAGRC